jgi:hypothetical protein
MNWVFISQKMAFFIVTAVKTSGLTTTQYGCAINLPNLVRILVSGDSNNN